MSLDSFKSRKTLKVGSKTYTYFSLKAAEKNGLPGISKLPYSMKVLLENLLRNEDGRSVRKPDIEAFVAWLDNRGKGRGGNRLPPGPRADAGFHRRSRRR
jgi:aconitate hydratase